MTRGARLLPGPTTTTEPGPAAPDGGSPMNFKSLTRVCAALLLLLLAPTLLCASARAADKISKQTIESQGRRRTYYLFAPSINRDAWDFLRRQGLGAEPRYEPYTSAGTARDFNSAVAEINALRAKGADALRRFNEGEGELRARQSRGDAQGAASLLREQAEVSASGASAFRASALAAERAAALKLADKYRQYLALVARADAKRAEAFEVLKARAELQLSGGPPGEVPAKLNEAAVRFQRLYAEADELERQADLARSGRGP